MIDRFGLFGVERIDDLAAAGGRHRAAGNRRGPLARSVARVETTGKVWTALVTVYVIWGSTYLGIAYAGETIPPLFAASTRFITAGAMMVGVVLLARRHAARLAPRAASRAS